MKKFWLIFIPGILLGASLILGGGKAMQATSSDEFCVSCHIHPDADNSWKKSIHAITRSGVKVHCVECHLPVKGEGYFVEKVKTGMRDLYGKLFKDSAEFNWEEKSRLEHAVNHVFESSCKKCHQNLFPAELTKKGSDAHLYYKQQVEKEIDIRCINCHLNAGHYDPNFTHDHNTGFGSVSSEPKEIFNEATIVVDHKPFKEFIPGSSVSFLMSAIPGGSFTMGSHEKDKYKEEDEIPQIEVELDPFFMGVAEVSWDEYMAFYAQTAGEGRSTDKDRVKNDDELDAIVGATPPYGQPDQGWGKGSRPAISISFHAAETYCKWLSKVTGKTYRLPTEAEWEYAARAGSEGDFFFEGDVKDYLKTGFLSSKRDTSIINTYVVYAEKSKSKTQEPSFVSANPFGLKNMLGNVAEFCSDWYSPQAYSSYSEAKVSNPKGPSNGEEHVVRGGSFKDLPDKLRSSDRDYTRTVDWLKTDPQSPKSIWWYSDCINVGFRVVCEFDKKTGNLSD